MSPKSPGQTNQFTNAETADPKWRSLYKVGGVAALSAVVLFIPMAIVSYLIWPPPIDGTVAEWFAFFQESSLQGLAGFDLFYLLANIALIPVVLALYVALKKTSASFMAIATVSVLFGIVALIVARPAFEMLSLSNQYAAATTDAQRTILLAAGQSTLAAFDGTAYHIHYIVGSLGLLIVSLVMLRSDIFGKKTAWIGIVANILVFGLYVPEIGAYISVFSVLFYWIWHLLIALKFLKLGWGQTAPANR